MRATSLFQQRPIDPELGHAEVLVYVWVGLGRRGFALLSRRCAELGGEMRSGSPVATVTRERTVERGRRSSSKLAGCHGRSLHDASRLRQGRRADGGDHRGKKESPPSAARRRGRAPKTRSPRRGLPPCLRAAKHRCPPETRHRGGPAVEQKRLAMTAAFAE